MDRIIEISGREILNANGKPTVEAEVRTENGISARASVPSGTSRGKYEAFELYDGGTRYGGYGTLEASSNISNEINEALNGVDVTGQRKIDDMLCKLDGTENKMNLGGNAILAASVAIAKAGAKSVNIPIYRYLMQENTELKIPDIIATVVSGGEYSPSDLEFEDYMMILHGFNNFPDELEALSSMRMRLEKNLREQYGDFPEDGGALAAPCESTEEAFDWILNTVSDMGYKNHVSLGLDVAASELYDSDLGLYKLNKREPRSAEDLLKYYKNLCDKYPLTFIEDGFDEDDFGSFAKLNKTVPNIQNVGDDLFATNIKRLKKGIENNSANGILLKINQIGTVTEAIKASQLAQANGYDVVVSLRSGETTDDFIADLAVAIGAKQIKLGSPVRAERNAKYNRLLRIWQEM